jgi:hypothetical protein
MPETNFEKLGPHWRAPGGEARHVGPGWNAVIGKSEARDTTWHEALPPPVEIMRTVPQPVPQRSEEELRERLAEELEAERHAQEVLDKASAAHQRAIEHAQKCKLELVSFEGLEAARDRHVLKAIYSEGCPDLPDTLSVQLLAREKARMAFAGADAAVQVIADDVAQARDRLAVRTKAVAIAIGRLFSLTADSFISDVRQHEAEIERLMAKLLGFDSFAAGLGRDADTLPVTWRDLYFQRARGRSASAEELSVWADAATKLHSNPQAEIEIGDPPPPAPRPKPGRRRCACRCGAGPASRRPGGARGRCPGSTSTTGNAARGGRLDRASCVRVA